MFFALILAACCFPFSRDEVEALEAEVLRSPPTTLAVATVGAAPDIPPLRPGELAPPPGATGSGLGILGVAPQGDDRDPSQVAVVFDRPMVALTDLETSSSRVPIRCSSLDASSRPTGEPIAGRMRWAGTSTAVIIPDGDRFPTGTAYRCSVPAGTAALDGTGLEGELSWSFSTLRPAVERTWPSEGEQRWDPADTLAIRFNQEVDPAALAPHLTLREAGGASVPLTLARGEGKRERPDLVAVKAKLKPDTGYELVLGAGLRGGGGPLGMAAARVIAFRTYPPLTLAEVAPADGPVAPISHVEVRFSTSVAAEEVNKHIHIAPTPPDGWRPAETYESTSWSYWLRFAPRTTYTVRLDPGIRDVHGQELKEGRSWSFTTGDLDPMVDAPDSLLVYPASNPTTLPIRHRNVSRLDLTMERVDPLQFALDRASGDDWRDRVGGGVVGLAVPQALNRVQVAKVDLAPYLVGGRGLVRVRASAPELRSADGWDGRSDALLQVTDLGTTLKLAPDGAGVWVTRLSDATVVPGASVRLVREGRILWSGTTDADGMAWASGDLVPDDWSSWDDRLWAVVQMGDDVALTSHQWTSGMQAWDFDAFGYFDPEQAKLEVSSFTDRGVYRPGETAHAQLVARQKVLDGLQAPGRRELSWTFSDPNGVELAKGAGTLNDMGAWAIDLPLPRSGALGDHALRTLFGDEAHTTSVSVRAYRAPAFRVDVAAPDTRLAGETLEATIEARYLFGAPMAGATLKWSIWRAPLSISPRGWEEFSFEALPAMDEWSDGEGPASVASGESRLDAAGRFVASQALPATDLKRPWAYSIEGTVTDVDRQQVSGRREVAVHVAESYAGIRAKTSLGTAGEPVEVEVVTVTPGGEPRGGAPVTLSVFRRTWDTIREKAMDGTWRWVSTPKDTPAGGGTITSGAQPAAWRFTPGEGGYHIVRATASDRAGRPTTSEVGVYVAGGDVSWAQNDTHKLELVQEKKTWKPGQKAKILVKAPRPGMRALVTVEREGIWSRRVVTLKTTSDTIEVPVSDAMMPNAFVSVLAVQGAPPADGPDAGTPAIWYGLTQLVVDASGQRAEVSVTTDRDAYQPRDEVKIHVEARRDGKAMPGARVTLWAVDYGVLSLTAYETPDLHEAFYRKRPLAVVTADNRISVYDRARYLAKGADVGGGGGTDGGGDARRLFETTPLWAPDLRTDARGALDHRFTLPDNLTTFRILAVVDDGRTAFGSGEHEVRVNRPLIARPAVPRFFRVGDRALAGVVIHNNTDAAVDVKVGAEASGLVLKGAPRTVSVEAGGAREVPFALMDLSGASVHLAFTAEGGGNRDAVEIDVPVSSPLPQEVVASAGSLTGDAAETIALPEGALPKVGGLTVSASASALVGAGASVDYLLDYPHGCLEQTGSRLRAALLAKQIGARAGLETPPEKLDEYVRVGLAAMDGFQTPSGGYAFWPGDSEASGLASAYALEVLAEAKRAGQPVRDEALTGLLRYVRRFLSGEGIPRWWTPEMTFAAQSRAALSLARADRGDAAFNTRMWDRRDGLPMFGRAQLLEAIARTGGGDARTRALTQDLEAALHIEATRAALVEPKRDRWGALWYGDDLPTAALVRAWMVSSPDHPLLPRLVNHLVKARSKGRWSNTYTTAEALSALSAYVERFETGAVKADIRLAGAPLLTADLGLGGQRSTFVPMESLKPGELLLHAEGGRLYYETRLAYGREELPPRDEGFTLNRTYEVLEGTGSGGQVAPGALVRVTLRVVTPIDRSNVALVDWLPAGLEPVDTSFTTTARALGGGADTGRHRSDTGSADDDEPILWSSWIFNRRELHDDHVVLFSDHMPAGIHVQTYLARATTPGDYAHPAATVEEMYAPETFGRTSSGRFTVGAALARR